MQSIQSHRKADEWKREKEGESVWTERDRTLQFETNSFENRRDVVDIADFLLCDILLQWFLPTVATSKQNNTKQKRNTAQKTNTHHLFDAQNIRTEG